MQGGSYNKVSNSGFMVNQNIYKKIRFLFQNILLPDPSSKSIVTWNSFISMSFLDKYTGIGCHAHLYLCFVFHAQDASKAVCNTYIHFI